VEAHNCREEKRRGGFDALGRGERVLMQPHFTHSHTRLELHPSDGLFHAYAWERCWP
jgi:hypothetical protein